MSNAIGSSHESNPSRRICHLRAVPPGHVADKVPVINKTFRASNQIKSSLYSPYYAEACNELRGPSPRLSAWATQLRRNAATVASRWRHCADLTGPGIEPQTSRTDSVRLATELTAGYISCIFTLIFTTIYIC